MSSCTDALSVSHAQKEKYTAIEAPYRVERRATLRKMGSRRRARASSARRRWRIRLPSCGREGERGRTRGEGMARRVGSRRRRRWARARARRARIQRVTHVRQAGKQPARAQLRVSVGDDVDILVDLNKLDVIVQPTARRQPATAAALAQLGPAFEPRALRKQLLDLGLKAFVLGDERVVALAHPREPIPPRVHLAAQRAHVPEHLARVERAVRRARAGARAHVVRARAGGGGGATGTASRARGRDEGGQTRALVAPLLGRPERARHHTGRWELGATRAPSWSGGLAFAVRTGGACPCRSA